MANSPPTDLYDLRRLLQAALADDRSAWNDLLTKLRPYLALLVRRRLASNASTGLGESSLVQETLLKIDQHFGSKAPEGTRFRGKEPPAFLNWIGQIVARVVANAIRDAHAPPRDRRREDENQGDFDFAALPEVDSNDEVGEMSVRVAAELEHLSEGRRIVLQHRYFEQLSFEEIAKILGKQPGAIRVTHLRALADLRERMGDLP